MHQKWNRVKLIDS